MSTPSLRDSRLFLAFLISVELFVTEPSRRVQQIPHRPMFPNIDENQGEEDAYAAVGADMTYTITSLRLKTTSSCFLLPLLNGSLVNRLRHSLRIVTTTEDACTVDHNLTSVAVLRLAEWPTIHRPLRTSPWTTAVLSEQPLRLSTYVHTVCVALCWWRGTALLIQQQLYSPNNPYVYQKLYISSGCLLRSS